MLYHRDDRTGDHLVTYDGQTQRFATRAEAITAGRELLLCRSATTTGPSAHDDRVSRGRPASQRGHRLLIG